MEFATIQQISVEEPASWDRKVFLTFDIDWAHDDILEDVIDLIERYNVSATWFVTHDTPVLKRLIENPLFELGIHPNFNYLLQGNPRNGSNARDIVSKLINIVPEAKSVRSHSLAFGSLIQEIFTELGITHDCNLLIPEQNNIDNMRPFALWDGLIRVPYYFCDYVRCIYKDSSTINELLHYSSIKVFDFHPIHVYLNTAHLKNYESTREWHHNPEKLINYRSRDAGGSRGLLKQLLQAVA